MGQKKRKLPHHDRILCPPEVSSILATKQVKIVAAMKASHITEPLTATEARQWRQSPHLVPEYLKSVLSSIKDDASGHEVLTPGQKDYVMAVHEPPNELCSERAARSLGVSRPDLEALMTKNNVTRYLGNTRVSKWLSGEEYPPEWAQIIVAQQQEYLCEQEEKRSITGNIGDLEYAFPRITREALERRATSHADLLASERLYYSDSVVTVPQGNETDEERVARWTVNYLRHNYSSYDEYYSPERHRDICNAIAQHFPWLRHEAEKQRDARIASAEAEEKYRLLMEQEAEIEKEERRRITAQKSEESRAKIASLSLGQVVPVKNPQGKWYNGTIIKINRVKVIIEYRLKTSSAMRRRSVYASEVVENIENKDSLPIIKVD